MLNPLRILRSSSKITLVTVVSVLLNFPLAIFIARLILPEELGQINFVILWLTYANLISLGIFSGGQREMIHQLGQGKERFALQAQNVAISGEMLWSLLPASFILLASAFFPEPLKKWGLVIISVTFLLATINKLLANLHLAHQRFDLYARLTLIRVLIPPVLIVSFVFVLGPLALLVAPLLAEGVLFVLYLTKAPRLELAADFDWIKMRSFIQIGFPLALAGFVYWAYRLAGQTSVAIWFSTEALAFYTFSANLVTLITRAFGDFSGVLMPVFWRELGQAGSPQQLHRETTRISIFVMTATCAMAGLAQAGFAPLVYLLLPKYVASIPIFEVLAFNVIVLTMTFIPSLVLDSAIVNKQWQHLMVWSVGLAINFAANYLVTFLGGGLVAIAWNDIWVQWLVVMGLFGLAQRYLYPNRSVALRMYLTVGFLMGVAGIVFVALRFLLQINAESITPITAMASAGIRAIFVLAIWGVIGVIISRTSFSISIPRVTQSK